MAEEEDLDLDVEAEGGAAGGGGKKWIIIGAIALVVILGGAAAAFFLLSGGDEPPPAAEVATVEGAEAAAPSTAAAPAAGAAKGPMQYLPMEPAFVVNFSADYDVRFMQISMQAGDRDSAVLDNVRNNLPAIRHAIVTLLQGRNPEELNTTEGAEKLREDVVNATRNVLKELTGDGRLETIYFTSFVMQ